MWNFTAISRYQLVMHWLVFLRAPQGYQALILRFSISYSPMLLLLHSTLFYFISRYTQHLSLVSPSFGFDITSQLYPSECDVVSAILTPGSPEILSHEVGSWFALSSKGKLYF